MCVSWNIDELLCNARTVAKQKQSQENGGKVQTSTPPPPPPAEGFQAIFPEVSPNFLHNFSELDLTLPNRTPPPPPLSAPLPPVAVAS